MAQQAAGGGAVNATVASSLGAKGHVDAAPPHASTGAAEPGAFAAWFSTLLLPMGVAAIIAGAIDPTFGHFVATPTLRTAYISFISLMVGLSLSVKSVAWAAVNVALPLVVLLALPSLAGAAAGASFAPLSTLSTLVESLLASSAALFDAQQGFMNVQRMLVLPFAVGRAIRNVAPGVARLADRSAVVLNVLASSLALLVLRVRGHFMFILAVSLVILFPSCFFILP